MIKYRDKELISSRQPRRNQPGGRSRSNDNRPKKTDNRLLAYSVTTIFENFIIVGSLY